jgi:hypothetical protein
MPALANRMILPADVRADRMAALAAGEGRDQPQGQGGAGATWLHRPRTIGASPTLEPRNSVRAAWAPRSLAW